MSVSESDDMIITEDHLKNSIRFLEETEIKMPRTFQYAGEFSKAENLKRLMHFIAINKEVSKDILMKEFLMYMSEGDLDEYLQALKTADFIDTITSSKGKNIIIYKPDDCVQNSNEGGE